MWWMGVTNWSVLESRVALRLANSSWVVIRPRFRRGAGIGMGAASGVAIWEGMLMVGVSGLREGGSLLRLENGESTSFFGVVLLVGKVGERVASCV